MNLRRCFVRPVLLVFLSGVLVFLNALVCLANNPGGFTTLVTTAVTTGPATNPCDASGNFSYTNGMSAGTPKMFFLFQLS
jgi:hypothetical protein